MAMGRRAKQRQQQQPFWVAHSELPRTVAHPFYQRLNQVLGERGFDGFVEVQCERFYAEVMGRPSLTPGRYFRLLLRPCRRRVNTSPKWRPRRTTKRWENEFMRKVRWKL